MCSSDMLCAMRRREKSETVAVREVRCDWTLAVEVCPLYSILAGPAAITTPALPSPSVRPSVAPVGPPRSGIRMMMTPASVHSGLLLGDRRSSVQIRIWTHGSTCRNVSLVVMRELQVLGTNSGHVMHCTCPSTW